MNESKGTILIPGSGPIVIGQAAEFDYSGTQAVKALRAAGYRVVLVNSNPATIMTDPEIADATYIEPLTVDALEAIIAQERPDYLLPTVGGQTGLNLALALSENGVLEKYGVKLIGATLQAIRAAEDRMEFRRTMLAAGIPIPEGGPAASLEEAQARAAQAGYPLLVRASFAMGGTGAGWVHEPAQLPEAVRKAIAASPIGQAWVEESVLGWKEFELEVMRDKADNFVVVCSIENLDPMGIHTGDSLTVAPAQTLTDREYQILRDLAKRVMTAVGVETGGSNVQFAVDPRSGRALVIEMNPRVSRSSALASKATGFPIAKIAALVAAGYTLDQIPNDITGVTRAAFEPSIDYVVVKIPRWAFEKFPGVDPTLGPQMKSVGEVLSLGRTFPEALLKAVQSLEIGVDHLDGSGMSLRGWQRQALLPEAISPQGERLLRFARNDMEVLRTPTAERLFFTYQAVRAGMPLDELAAATGFDPWFLGQMLAVAQVEREITGLNPGSRGDAPRWVRAAKRLGFADTFLARAISVPADEFRSLRKGWGITPTFLRVDTCAAEFVALTPYLYSSYESADEARPTGREKILILGGGPNRIGQGIEFDYCCCQAAFALRAMGYETIMLNCNPETVSTDYDTADRLYFEPLTLEHVLNVVEAEQPRGVMIQFGGQTPLNLAAGLEAAGVRILGTSPESIRLSEDRERFAEILAELEIPQPEHGIARSLAEARAIAERIGYPVLVRPSFVLGGRAMAIVGEAGGLEGFVREALDAAPGQPLLVDRFLEDAYEVDIDALCDGERVVIGAVMQHIEEAGIHSGDSACVLPPYKVSAYHLGIMRDYAEQLGLALGVRGLMNVQFALKDDVVYVLEVNPRASRTVPYASKATGTPLARLAAQVMAGRTLAGLGLTDEPKVDGFFVKEAVMPFNKLPGADPRLGPEMRSTGEVMGHASRFGHAFAKSQLAAGMALPLEGAVLISVNDFDKGSALKIARDLHRMGFTIHATPGTAAFFNNAGVPARSVNQMHVGSPHTVDLIRGGGVQLIINTPLGAHAHADGEEIRAAAVQMAVPYMTTLSAAAASVAGIRALREKGLRYRSLQAHYGGKAG
jgi:carbamoyl-phosphate synthase large subunit